MAGFRMQRQPKRSDDFENGVEAWAAFAGKCLVKALAGQPGVSRDLRHSLGASNIAKAGFDPVYGARPLKRAIQSQIENPLAKQILEGKFAAKDTIIVDVKRGVIVFEKA